MGKEEAKKQLLKDLIPFFVTAGLALAFMLFGLITNYGNFHGIFEGQNIFVSIIAFILAPIIMGVYISGLICGWKWASKRWVALNLWGLLIKLIISVLAGYIIFPVKIIKDIIAIVRA